MLKSIKQIQAKKFKQGYIGEMELIITYLKDKVKADEDFSAAEITEAKQILADNLDKIGELNLDSDSDDSDYTY